MMRSHNGGKKLENIDLEIIVQLTPRIYVFSAKAFGSRELRDNKLLKKNRDFNVQAGSVNQIEGHLGGSHGISAQ